MLPYFATSSGGSSRQLAALLEEALKSRSPQRAIAGDVFGQRPLVFCTKKPWICFFIEKLQFWWKTLRFWICFEDFEERRLLWQVIKGSRPTVSHDQRMHMTTKHQPRKKNDVLRISVWISDWGMFHQPTKSRSSLKGSKNLLQKQKNSLHPPFYWNILFTKPTKIAHVGDSVPPKWLESHRQKMLQVAFAKEKTFLSQLRRNLENPFEFFSVLFWGLYQPFIQIPDHHECVLHPVESIFISTWQAFIRMQFIFVQAFMLASQKSHKLNPTRFQYIHVYIYHTYVYII